MLHWFKQKGHALDNLETHVNAVINALIKTIESADCTWLLADRTNRQSELSITTLDVFGAPQEHRLDLTFIEEETQKRWIIDYKLTFSEDVKELDLIAQQHRPQLSRYAALFEQDGLPIQTAVFFLAHGKLVLL